MIKSMKIIHRIKEVKNIIKPKIDNVIEKIALHFVFMLGIGLTAIVSKLLFKKFLVKHHSFTSWKRKLTKNNLNKMY
ncbi:MAG: hypothetical protein GW941_02300 [Candidatus Pacebacteria bacterium]|nr:hypothetical protein [Candidatus Paceibacterota bacterium]